MPYAAAHSSQCIVVGSTRESGLTAKEALACLERPETRMPTRLLSKSAFRKCVNGILVNQVTPNYQEEDIDSAKLRKLHSRVLDSDAKACTDLHDGIAAIWEPACKWTVSKVHFYIYIA
jgi:hypothetical protein